MGTAPLCLEEGVFDIPYTLPESWEGYRETLELDLVRAQTRLKHFVEPLGWTKYMAAPLAQQAELYADKESFDQRLIELSEGDADTEIPLSYTAALEQGVLLSVSPKLYLKVYPQGQDLSAFEKLLTHELVHQFHIRLLKGKEHKMGPIWFFEGLATLIADQFPKQTGKISQAEVWRILNESDRGDYRSYNQVIKYFLRKTDLPSLVQKAGEPQFLEWLMILEAI